MSDLSDISLSLACKLGSILTHTEELLSPTGHAFDRTALDTLLNDEEVTSWIGKMQDAALVPLKR